MLTSFTHTLDYLVRSKNNLYFTVHLKEDKGVITNATAQHG